MSFNLSTALDNTVSAGTLVGPTGATGPTGAASTVPGPKGLYYYN